MEVFMICCDKERDTNYCSRCGKRLKKPKEYTLDTLYSWLINRLEKETLDSRKDQWNGWIEVIQKITNERDRNLALFEKRRLELQEEAQRRSEAIMNRPSQDLGAAILDVAKHLKDRKGQL
jgi:hypothetical protein